MSSQPHLVCEEKTRLLKLLENAEANHARALELMRQARRTMPKADYDRFRIAVESTRTAATEAEAAYKAHAAQHGC